MAEHIRAQQDRIDSMDQTKDKKISIVEGREEEMTETYIKNLDRLIEKMDELDPGETEWMREEISSELQSTTTETLDERKRLEFDINLDANLTVIERRIELRRQVEGLDTSGWEESGGWNGINYKTIMVDNPVQNLSAQTIETLGTYINKANDVSKRYKEKVEYFTNGVAQTPENNEILETLLGEPTVRAILSGEVSPQEIETSLQAFEESVSEIENKINSCEEFIKLLKGDSNNAETTPRLLANIDNLTMIATFVRLVEIQKIDPNKAVQTMEELLTHPEIKQLFIENTTTGVNFLINGIIQLEELEGEERQEQLSSLTINAEELKNFELKIKETAQEFSSLGAEIGISIETLQDYSRAYLETPETRRIPITEIKQIIAEIKQEWLTGHREEQVKVALIEAFGKLINGERTNLIPEIIYEINIENKGKELAEIQTRLEEHLTRLNIAERNIESGVQGVTRYTRENPRVWEAWNPSTEEVIKPFFERVMTFSDLAEKEREAIAPLETQENEILVSILHNQQKILEIKGQNLDEFFLEIRRNFGPDVPEVFREGVETTIQAKINDPNTPEYEKLLYQGKYQEAMDLISREDRENSRQLAFSSQQQINSFYEETSSGARQQISFPEGSFAANRIKQGWMAPSMENSERGGISDVYLLVNKNEKGTLGFFYVARDGSLFRTPPLRARTGENGRTLPWIIKEEDLEADQQENENKERCINMILEESPAIKALERAAKIMEGKFKKLQELFSAGHEGRTTSEVISLAKRYAWDIKNSPELRQIEALLPEAKQTIRSMERFSLTSQGETLRGENTFKLKIQEMSENLNQIEHAFDANKIRSFCEYITTSNYNVDDFFKFANESLLPFLTTVLFACVAIALVCSGGGAVAGVAIMAKMAAVGTIGGMVGQEIGSWGSTVLGQELIGEDYTNRTSLQRLINNEEIYNPHTGEWEKVEGMNVLKEYGTQAVVGFFTTFAILGAGRTVGNQLSKFIINNKHSSGFKETLSKILSKCPRFNTTKTDALKSHNLNRFHQRVTREWLEELGEEGAETVAEHLDERLGLLVSVMMATNGGRQEHSLGRYQVTHNKTIQFENGMGNNFSYNKSQKSDLLTHLNNAQTSNGENRTIRSNDSGEILVEQTFRTRKGAEFTVTTVFSPTTENTSMRQFLSQNENVQRYGIKMDSSNNYTYENATPQGMTNITQAMKTDGFIIQGNSEAGHFIAIKGDTRISLTQEITQQTDATQSTTDTTQAQTDATQAPTETTQETETQTKLGRLRQGWDTFMETYKENLGTTSFLGTAQIAGAIKGLHKGILATIPQGQMRERFVDIMETRDIKKIQKKLKTTKKAVEIELVGNPVISEANHHKVASSLNFWMHEAVSSNESDSQIVDQTNKTAFLSSMPKQMDLKFNNGTNISILFPHNYHGDFVNSFLRDVASMEMWIQTQFAERGIHPKENLTILIINEAPGGNKIITGGGTKGHIILNGTSAFLETSNQSHRMHESYLHERTHSILSTASLNPFNPGIREGIATYMGKKGFVDLGFGSRTGVPMERAIGHIEILDSIIIDNKTFKDALWDYLGQNPAKKNYVLNYEYGEAFVQAFVKHHHGDISKLLQVYAELSSVEYQDYSHIGAELAEGMLRTGISKAEINAILTQTSGNLLLRSYNGLALMDVLIRRPSQEIASILGPEQSLEEIFGVEMATTRQLTNLVFQAEKHLVSAIHKVRKEGIDINLGRRRSTLIITRLKKLLNNRRAQANLAPI